MWKELQNLLGGTERGLSTPSNQGEQDYCTKSIEESSNFIF